MNNFFEVDVSNKSKPTIIIRRKPSQIPFHIDRKLIEFAGLACLDGLNNKVTYEFILPNKLSLAEDFLKRCGWIKEDPDFSRFEKEMDQFDFDRPEHH